MNSDIFFFKGLFYFLNRIRCISVLMNTQINNYKIVLIGDTMVGKTMISNVLVDLPFSNEYAESAGASMVKIDFINKNTGGKSCISLWDTAGQEKFHALASVFFQGAQVAIIVYDVSNETSFQHIHYWRDLFLDHSQAIENKFLIVGNKIDLRNESNNQGETSSFITTERGKECACSINADFIEVSAKTGDNINLLMDKMIEYAQTVIKKTTLPVLETKEDGKCFSNC